MTVDAGRAAFEELKRLSAPLVEFVAVNQGIPHEIVFKVLLGLGNAVRLSAGQAAAAVLLNKPAEQVTEAEALKAIRGIAVEGEGEGDRGLARSARCTKGDGLYLGAGGCPGQPDRACYEVEPSPG